MTNDRTLVILIPGFPADAADSTCLPAQQRFVKTINKLYPGVNIVVLALQYPFREAVYDWHGNTIIAFAGRNKGGLLRLLLWRRVTKTLNSLNKHSNIIGVLGFWAGECALIGKQWSRRNRKPFYCWIMGQDTRKENHYLRRSGISGQQLICISDFSANELQQNHGIHPAHVIPLGIDTSPASQKKDIDLFGAGSLIPLKQYHICIEVMTTILATLPAVQLVLAGKGPGEEKLRGLILEKGLQANISLVGEKSHEEVLQLMGRTRVFLHPSNFEGFSMACLEALAAGAIVISFHQPMKNDIVNWHVVKSPAEMASKAIEVLRGSVTTRPVIPYSLADTTRHIMKLFGL